MGETIPGGNINQTAGDWHWRQRPGWGAPNPIPSDAPTQSTLIPQKANPIAVNQDPIVPGKGQPISVSGSALYRQPKC
jgi:hypothetical protein